MDVERIDSEATREHMLSSHALLVCAYDSPEKFRQNVIDDAISLQELEARAPRLPPTQEIVFYCA